MKIYRARYESRNFSFEALGSTKSQALDAIYEGLKTHAEQYGLAAEWWREFENDLFVYEVTIGVCLRDGQPLEVNHA